MHVSHISEDLEAWYLNFDSDERVDTAFRPRPAGASRRRRRCRSAPTTSSTSRRRAPRLRPLRTRSATARRSRRPRACQRRRRGADGTVYPRGHGDPAAGRLQHARQPVLLERDPERDRMERRAGGGRPLRRLQPDERRLPPQPARDGWHMPDGEKPRSPFLRAPGRASTRSFARHTGRTSSSPEAPPLVPARRAWWHRGGPPSLRGLAEEGLAPLRTSPPGPVFSSAVASASETSTIVVAVQRGHPPEAALVDEVGRLQPVARREHAVARRSACRRAGRARARSPGSRSRSAPRSRARELRRRRRRGGRGRTGRVAASCVTSRAARRTRT